MVVRVPGLVAGTEAPVAIATNHSVTASFALDAARSNVVERSGTWPEGSTSPDRDWVLEGFQAACNAAGRDVPVSLRTRAISNIPFDTGLGAASAATVAGIVGARALLVLPLDDAAIVRIASAIDGGANRVAALVAEHQCTIYASCDDPPTAGRLAESQSPERR